MAVGSEQRPYGALLDAVRGVRWPAGRLVPGGAPGSHQARSRGVAPEFAEYRPYRQGDDPRRIDWKLLARSDRAFIRLAPDHAILGTTFIVDASASMAFGKKWQMAKELVIALAAAAHAGADPVGLAVATAHGARHLEPRTRRGVVTEFARLLDEVRPMGSAPLAPSLTGAAARCVVVTDCLGDFDALRQALGRHRAIGGEAHLLHVVARAELEPPTEPMMATDPEDPALQRPLMDSTREAYLGRFAEFRADIARQVRGDGVWYHDVVDDVTPEVAVRRIVTPGQPAESAGTRR